MTVVERTLHALRLATRPISAAGLADVVYAGDPQGGPATATEIVKIAIVRLQDSGHDIETTRTGYVYRGVITGPVSTTHDRRRDRADGIAERRRMVQELRGAGRSVATISWVIEPYSPEIPAGDPRRLEDDLRLSATAVAMRGVAGSA